ncbi:threonylcarbamoyl-AMP synthase [bacterium]|nr:threonylcarbamoyl-AMP synthase [bacterium]
MLVLKCHEELNPKDMERAAEIVRTGGVVVYPTDTVYGMGCDLNNPQAIGRIYSIKKIPHRKPLSLLCSDPRQISAYAQISGPAFNLMRRITPGPYTLIMQATRLVPRIMMTKQRTVGIRIPDNQICLALIRALGNPLVNTSATDSSVDDCSDPDVIAERYPNIDLLIDAGPLSSEYSTMLDISTSPITILREGKGPIDEFISEVY